MHQTSKISPQGPFFRTPYNRENRCKNQKNVLDKSDGSVRTADFRLDRCGGQGARSHSSRATASRHHTRLVQNTRRAIDQDHHARVPEENTALDKDRAQPRSRSGLQIPFQPTILSLIQLLRQTQLLFCQNPGLHPNPITTLNPIHNSIPNLPGGNIPSQFVSHSRHPLLHTRNMLILQFRLRNIQHLPKNTEIGINKNTAVMEYRVPPDTTRSSGHFLPVNLDIVDRLKLGLHSKLA